MEGKDASCLQKFEMNGDNLNLRNVIDDVLLSSATGSDLVENHSGDEDAALESMFERQPGKKDGLFDVFLKNMSIS